MLLNSVAVRLYARGIRSSDTSKTDHRQHYFYRIGTCDRRAPKRALQVWLYSLPWLPYNTVAYCVVGLPVFIYENVAQALAHACFKVFSGQYCMSKLSRHVSSLKSIATLLNSISLPMSWLPIFVIALSLLRSTLNVYTPTDLQGMASSGVTPRAEMTRAQTHRAPTPDAE